MFPRQRAVHRGLCRTMRDDAPTVRDFDRLMQRDQVVESPPHPERLAVAVLRVHGVELRATCSSTSFLAEISVTSPRKSSILII